MAQKSSKKSSSSTPVSSTPVSINDFPAVPLLYNRLMRLNYGLSTLQSKVNAIEQAITAAPINLLNLQDDLKIEKYIEAQKQYGVKMSKGQAQVLLGIIRSNGPVKLTGASVVRSNVRSNESLELKENDQEVLKLYKQYGFLTHTEFCKAIQADGVVVTPSVLSRYSNLAKQVAYLQGKQGNSGYLQDIQKGDPLGMLAELSAHEKYKSDMSTFALCKRAVKIYAALTE